jgi:hypothetical protein
MVTLWCGYPRCGKGYASVAGDIPKICPACEKPGRWRTEVSVPRRHTTRTFPYDLSAYDTRLLKLLRIDWREPADEA